MQYIEKHDSEFKYSKLFLLSLISTSPLHSEIISSPISLDLANLFKDTNFFESDEESYQEWEESSSNSEDTSEKIEKNDIKDINNKEQLKISQVSQDHEVQNDKWEEESSSNEEEKGRSFDNPCNLLSQFFESLCEKDRKNSPQGYVLPWPYKRKTEREIIINILMMLLGMNTDIFEWRTSSFIITDKIEVSHMTPSCLNNILLFFTDLGTIMYRINEISESLLDDECFAYQYFGKACKDILSEFRREIINIQEELTIQSGNSSRKAFKKIPQNVLSLISLKNRLCSMHEHGLIIKSITEKLSKDPLIKTRDLLNNLYGLIQNNYSLTDHAAFSIVVRLFITTVQPFVEDMSIWLSQGTVRNLDPGFMIEKTHDKKSMADSWASSFNIRTYEKISTVPKFLKEIEKEILIAGKNMMLIRKIEETILDHVLPPASKLLINLENSIYDNLLKSSGHFLNQIILDSDIIVSSVTWDFNSPQAIKIPQITSFTEFNMKSQSSPSNILVPSHYLIPEYHSEIKDKSNSNILYPIQSWISFQNILDLTISSTIIHIYNDSCEYILKLLREKFKLNDYFTSLREILLMENGECMRVFLNFINKKSDLQETFENSFELSNAFSESIKNMRKKELGSHFSCELIGEAKQISTIEGLENIKINFNPPTPLDICFDEESIKNYQKMFTRILQIKRAVYCVRGLKWRSKEFLKENEVYRNFLIFQKKLIHFTNCYEEYILQNVLHTSANMFKIEEAKAKSIDDLRGVHKKYLNHAIDRCLLSTKTVPLNNAVSAIFSCCANFYKLTKKISSKEIHFESHEMQNYFEDIQNNFETANRILLQVLSKNSQNRRNMQCKIYIDMGSYFSMNFNRYYIYD